MKKLLAVAVLYCSVAIPAMSATLLRCEGVSTAQGFKYVGTYCMDYDCKYVQRYVFNSWCPYSI
jgi:hypothetical protein